MERMGTCGVCAFYSEKVDYTDCSEGKCFVNGQGQSKWVSSRDTCERHEENRDLAVLYLQRDLEEVQARLCGFRQRIGDCKVRIVKDEELICQVEPRETKLLAELKERGVDPNGDDDDD